MYISRRAMTLALALTAFAPALAQASPDQSLSTDTLRADWTGPVGNGVNTSFLLDGLAGRKGTCGPVDDPQTACDKTLVHVTGIAGEGSSVTFRIDSFLPVSDFDLRVYLSDETGALESDLGSPSSSDVSESSELGKDDPRYTSAGDYENKVIDVGQYADFETGELDAYFVVAIPYFIVANDSYQGHATLDAKPFVAPDE